MIERGNLEFVGNGVQSHVDGVAGRNIFAVFHLRAVYQNPAQLNMFLCQRTGLEKARGPQPFVQAHGRIVMIVFHSLFEMIELN